MIKLRGAYHRDCSQMKVKLACFMSQFSGESFYRMLEFDVCFHYRQSKSDVEANSSRHTVSKVKDILKPVFIGLLRDDNAKVKLKEMPKIEEILHKVSGTSLL